MSLEAASQSAGCARCRTRCCSVVSMAVLSFTLRSVRGDHDRSQTLHSLKEVKAADVIGKGDPEKSEVLASLSRSSMLTDKKKTDAQARAVDPFTSTARDTLRLRAAGTRVLESAGAATGGIDLSQRYARDGTFTKSFKSGVGLRS